MTSWETHAETWKAMPLSSSVFFFAAVFCLFATLNMIGSWMSFRSQSVFEVVMGACISGGFAIAWAFAGTRRKFRLFWAIGVLEFAAFSLLEHFSGAHHVLSSGEMRAKLTANGVAEMILVVGGYILFLIFFSREGARFFRTQAEVKLAGEIHRALVPVRHDTIGAMELFGTSIASSEVGGDLFDIVESDGKWHAYVADVSGHGVAAGILMSMIKSAASMQLRKLKKPAELLVDLNDVMQPYTSPANYLTFAYVGGNGTDNLNYALAGHLPILHYQTASRSIIEHSDANVPIGMFKDQNFAISKLTMQPGDLLAIITDGFTEVFDKQNREIGMDDFKAMLLACAQCSLPEIYRELRENTTKFGRQTDDQTLLLIRRTV